MEEFENLIDRIMSIAMMLYGSLGVITGIYIMTRQEYFCGFISFLTHLFILKTAIELLKQKQ